MPGNRFNAHRPLLRWDENPPSYVVPKLKILHFGKIAEIFGPAMLKHMGRKQHTYETSLSS